jgi:hypothetical protein
VRASGRRRRLGPLLGLALGGAFTIPAGGAFEVYCESTGVNTIGCQRLDEAGSGQVMICVENLSNTRTCTTPEGQVRTCVRSRGNVFSCETPVDGSPDRSRCQFTGSGMYACEKHPKAPQQALPVGGSSVDDDNVVDDADLDHDLFLDDLND